MGQPLLERLARFNLLLQLLSFMRAEQLLRLGYFLLLWADSVYLSKHLFHFPLGRAERLFTLELVHFQLVTPQVGSLAKVLFLHFLGRQSLPSGLRKVLLRGLQENGVRVFLSTVHLVDLSLRLLLVLRRFESLDDKVLRGTRVVHGSVRIESSSAINSTDAFV